MFAVGAAYKTRWFLKAAKCIRLPIWVEVGIAYLMASFASGQLFV
jgi:hypothetical protein